MEVFDKDGNLIEGDFFSQEELDEKLEEIKQQMTKETPVVPAPVKPAVADNQDEMPQWAKELKASVDGLNQNQTQSYLKSVTSMLDADKKTEVEKRFASLAGYDNTPEGLQRRAEDAHLLATGERYNSNGVNMPNIMAAGGGRTQVDATVTPEADKNIRQALGISEADAEKFSKK